MSYIQCLALGGYLTIAITSFIATGCDWKSYAMTPSEIHELLYLNWPFSIIMAVVTFVFNPLQYLVRFLYWISHVERRSK